MNIFFSRMLVALFCLAGGWFFIGQYALRVPHSAAQTPGNALQLEPFLSGLQAPVFLTSARDGSNRLFILEQPGRIRVRQPGATTTTVFLDITAKVLAGGERGLLGLAFHPQFNTNRRFFVNYTRRPDGATVIAEYQASATNPNLAEDAEKPILSIPQPFENHNGGMLAFGPDELLYIGMGDGGSGNDPGNRAQNIEELLGKILRVDINNANGAQPYSSPTTNPFFGNTPGRDEIYAVGLRNPWRFSFDRQTGELYAGDVGQGQVEEIDKVTLGGNYGWRVLEGTRCTNLGPGSCADPRFLPPLYEYPHVGGGCSGSVTGGYVYRGTANTFAPGTYVFGDYCRGTITALENGAARELFDTTLGITSFGEDEAGELYMCAGAGSIFKLVRTPNALANVSAASYRGENLAPESIVAAFGTDLATGTQTATTTPLPTELLGTRVQVRDQAGTERTAPLFFVSPTQVNYLLPAGTTLGQARVTISSGQGALSAQDVNIASTAPGLFTLNASGRGLPAAVVIRIGPSGGQSVEPIARLNPATNQYEAIPIVLAPEQGQLVYLAAFGTGFRNRSGQPTATIGGENALVGFAGAQGSLIGVDQANIGLPNTLAGRGEVEVVLTIEGQAANPVRIQVQ